MRLTEVGSYYIVIKFLTRTYSEGFHEKIFFLVMFLATSELMYGMDKDLNRGMQAQQSDEATQFTYGDCPKVLGYLSKEFYRQAMENMPIICVDVFLLNTKTNRYLVVFRNNRPAKDVFFIPGGRLCKGETFFEAARRKCQQELGINATPQVVLGVNNLIFPDSEWGTAGHTPSVLVFATCEMEEEDSLKLDKMQHTIYRWCSIFEPSNVDYTERARLLTLTLLGSKNF